MCPFYTKVHTCYSYIIENNYKKKYFGSKICLFITSTMSYGDIP